eukprot:763117-Hanusia_phi.AAC.2
MEKRICCKKKNLSADDLEHLCYVLQALKLTPRQLHEKKHCKGEDKLFYGYSDPRFIERQRAQLLRQDRMDFRPCLLSSCSHLGCKAFETWRNQWCVSFVVNEGDCCLESACVLHNIFRWSIQDWDLFLVESPIKINASILIRLFPPKKQILLFFDKRVRIQRAVFWQ